MTSSSPAPFTFAATSSIDLRARIAEIYIATAAQFCTTTSDPLNKNWLAGQPSFLKVQGEEGNDPKSYRNAGLVYIWGDVLKGIEEMPHNVTAGLLTLPLGTMDVQCFFDYQALVYQYRSFVLWVPYGVGRFFFLLCYDLIFSPLCFIDGLGHCSTFTSCCRQDNGEK